MKKPRGKVLKRYCRSSYHGGSRNLDRESPMKTEERLEPTAVFIQRVIAAVSELKDDLQHGHIPAWGEIIRIVLDEEEAKAWELSFFAQPVPARHGGSAHRQSQPIAGAVRRSHDPMRLRHEIRRVGEWFRTVSLGNILCTSS